jgi:hypothetical protein
MTGTAKVTTPRAELSVATSQGLHLPKAVIILLTVRNPTMWQGAKKKMLTNQDFTKNPLFAAACDLANCRPTKRQASKFRRKTGLAYDQRTAAAAIIAENEEKENANASE